MISTGCFILGCILGYFSFRIVFKPIHDAFEVMQAQYRHLVDIISQWQKKI